MVRSTARGANRTNGVLPGMPIIDRVRTFLRSPQGQRLTDRGRRMASDPRNRARAQGFLARLRRR